LEREMQCISLLFRGGVMRSEAEIRAQLKELEQVYA
jgi:hypothetical protein